MFKVIATEGVLKEVVGQVFGMIVPENKDLVIVLADQLDDELVKEVAAVTERPMLICSLATGRRVEGWHVIGKLLAEEGVCYAKLPIQTIEAMAMVSRAWEGKPSVKTPETVAFISETQLSCIGILLHDMYPGKGDSAIARGLASAEKDFGFTGSVEEVRAQLEELRERLQKPIVEEAVDEGVIAGAFCDVEGTLILGHQLIPGRLAMLAEYAKTGPVTLWTGGNLGEISEKLVALCVPYRLVSKYGFKGKTVEIAIDDMSEADVEKAYGIKAEEFIHLPV